jgi:hypothetical protein
MADFERPDYYIRYIGEKESMNIRRSSILILGFRANRV